MGRIFLTEILRNGKEMTIWVMLPMKKLCCDLERVFGAVIFFELCKAAFALKATCKFNLHINDILVHCDI